MKKIRQKKLMSLEVIFCMALLRRFVVGNVVGCGVVVRGVVKFWHAPHSQKNGHFLKCLERKKKGHIDEGKEDERQTGGRANG